MRTTSTKSANSKSTKHESPSQVSVVEAREKLGDLVNRAALRSERIYVTKHGKRVAALVPVNDAELLEALEDRMDIEAIKAARADITVHGTVSLEQLAKELGL